MASTDPRSATPPPDWSVRCKSPRETRALAARIAPFLRGGDVLLLSGPLGAGKTFLTTALAESLGVTEPVSSPSYVLHRPHAAAAGLTLHHVDLYRLSDRSDVDMLGFDELAAEDAIVIVEWPERCPGAFGPPTLEITIEVKEIEERLIEGRWDPSDPRRDASQSIA